MHKRNANISLMNINQGNNPISLYNYNNFQINGFVLKILGIVAMLLDHIGALFFDIFPYLIINKPFWKYTYYTLRYLGRFSFPIFAFLLVEGVLHTHSKKKYLIRMLIFAIVSEIPYDLLFNDNILEFSNQNILFTFCLGIIALSTFIYIREDAKANISHSMVKVIYLTLPAFYFGYYLETIFFKYINIELNKYLLFVLLSLAAEVLIILLYSKPTNEHDQFILCSDVIVLAIFMAVAELLHLDYASRAILVFYFIFLFRGNYIAGFASATFILGVLSSAMELINILLLPVINNYNGKEGRKMGIFFYFVYPGHILILILIKKLLVGI